MSFQMEQNLRNLNTTLATSKVSWLDWCKNYEHDESNRYTLVTKDEKILCDTDVKRAGTILEDATEIRGSFEKGFFVAVRESDHFNTLSVFAGLKLSDELAIRQIVPISSLKDDLKRFDRVLFYRIVPFALLSYFFFLFLFYRASQPLGKILGKVDKFKVDIPFNKNLQLLYKKNEWAQIEEALNEADSKLEKQVQQVKTENEKIAAILESIYDDIIAIDSFETVLFYNTNFKKNFIQERRSQELVPKIWHTFSDEKVLAAFRKVLSTGQTVVLSGMTFLSSLKPDSYFDLTITPLRNNERKVNGALGVFYDVTQFKLTEQMRVDFVANVSHEIRTPLTSIKGFTQVLQGQKDKVDPNLHGFLDKIITNTERMISLFNDLLNLSVIESKNALRFEELQLDELVGEVTSSIATNYEKKDINIETDLQLSKIMGDRRLIEQVISNLVDNACKYSGEHTSVKVSSFQKEKKAYIVVADNGPGISKEHLQRIFERFYRVDSSRESSRGTGLGLSIAKHIIAKHGGTIWAESEESQGTTFVIELPVI